MDQMQYPGEFEFSIFLDDITFSLIPGPFLLVGNVVGSFMAGGILSGMEGLVAGHLLCSSVTQTLFKGLRYMVRHVSRYEH